jgi:hypothetical protein
MYKKYVFIGLGGSGGKTLRFMKNELRRWMDDNGAAGMPIPDAWQFLHIDTPTVPDGTGMATGIPMLDQDEYLGLVGPGVSFSQVGTILDSQKVLHDEIQTWRVEPAALGVPIAEGAGQFRAVGKMISLAYLQTIRNRIDMARNRVSQAGSLVELSELYSKITGERPEKDSDTVFVIISSLAGGTGAGLLFPVTDLLRALDPVSGANSIGLLFTPEVFASLATSMTMGVQPNSLAAISELLNGYWWGGSHNSDTATLVAPKNLPSLQFAGAPTAIDRSGPRFPFLIGRTGAAGVAFDTPEDLYQMVGRALVSWVADPAMADELVAYVKANWENAAVNHAQGDVLVGGTTGFNVGSLAHETGYPCISGIGFSRLGIGSDWFERYSSRRIAYDALRHIARAHIDSHAAKSFAQQLNSQDPTEVAEALAKQQMSFFLTSCGLSEFGPNDNQIQDALRPKSEVQLKADNRTSAEELAGLTSAVQKTSQEWLREIRNSIGNVLNDYPKRYQTALDQSVLEWVFDMPSKVLKETELLIARSGLKVASAVLRLATQHLVSNVVPELNNVDYNDYSRWGNSWQDAVDKTLAGMTGRQQSNDQRLLDALLEGLRYGEYQGDALIAARAAALVEDFAENFIRPLSEALEHAATLANDDLGQVSGWPEWTAINPPAELCPPVSEFVLIQPNEYSKIFEDLLERTTNPDRSSTARDIVRMDVLSAEFVHQWIDNNTRPEKEVSHLLALKVEKPWWPGHALVTLEVKPQSRAAFKVAERSSDLVQRAEAWLHRPLTPFADLLECGLRSYLADTTTYKDGTTSEHVYRERQDRFAAQLQAAISASAPLVKVSASTMAVVHPANANVENRHNVTSQIPLRGHVMEDQIEQILRNRGVGDGTINKILTSDGTAKHVDFSSILWPPHSPLVMESLMKPIQEVWSKAVAGRSISGFWNRRRAAKISEFIPAPYALIVAMARGWYTAGLMGLLDRTQEGIRISDGQGNISNFPYPMLTPSAHPDDHLPRVLESLPIAYLEVGLNSALTPLRPYRVLRDLGRSADGAMFNYDVINEDLQAFIEGRSQSQSIQNPLISSQGVHDRALEAEQVLLNYAIKLGKLVDAENSARSSNPSKLSGPPLFTGLWEVSSKVLDDLALRIRELGQVDNTGPGL